MRHFDDIHKFIAEYDNLLAPVQTTTANDAKIIIAGEIQRICDRGKFPEWLYRYYLRGNYRNCREFITKVCDKTLCDHQTLMINNCDYTLEALEKTPDAQVIKIYEEHGISNFKELSLKAYANTVNLILKTQRNIIQDLDSPVIEVRQEAAKLAVKIAGPKMATYLPSSGDHDDGTNQETDNARISESEDIIELDNQTENSKDENRSSST